MENIRAERDMMTRARILCRTLIVFCGPFRTILWPNRWHFCVAILFFVAVHRILTGTTPTVADDVYIKTGSAKSESTGGSVAEQQWLSTDQVEPPDWEDTRKVLLSSTAERKLYLFTYMRGGSTLLGQVFNQDPDSVYWYEPLNMFYGAYFGMPQPRHTHNINFNPNGTLRSMEDWESESLLQYIRNLLTCNLQSLPIDALSSNFLSRSSRILSNYYTCYNFKEVDDVKKTLGIQNMADHKFGQLCPDSSGLGKNVCNLNNGNHSNFIETAIRNRCPQLMNMTKQWYSSRHALNITVLHSKAQEMLKKDSYVKNKGSLSDKMDIFVSHQACLEQQQGRVARCLEPSAVMQSCKNTTLRTLKILRLKMMNFQPVIKEIPDLFVIHFLRDPRSIAHSLSAVDMCKPKDQCFNNMVPQICKEMVNDIENRKILENKYPGAFLQVKYEDLIRHPNTTLHTMYDFMGRKLPPEVLKWFEKNTSSSRDGGSFSVKRKNATSLIDKWRKAYSDKVKKYVSQDPMCVKLFQMLGYDPN